MTFRGRLTAFFAALVLAPLLAGAVVVHALAGRQAVREADGRLAVQEITALRVEERMAEDVRLRVTESFATRAFHTSSFRGLDRMRTAAGLGFVVVGRSGRPATVAMGAARFPAGTAPTPAAILRDPGSLPVVARRIDVTGPDEGTVVGGEYLDRTFLQRIGVPAMVVRHGFVVVSNLSSPVPKSIATARSFDLAGGFRALCVCTGSPPTGLVLLTKVPPVGLLPSLPGPVIALIIVGAALAALLAFELARVLSKPHERALHQLVETEHLSLTDPLTGVPNRRHLERILADEAKRAGRFERPFSVLMIDVDRFKQVNDTHGHAVGDRVLVEVAERIRGFLRTDLDTVARFGGEEFTVILPETGGEGAAVVAEKLRAAVAATPFRDGFQVTVSVGVATRPEDGAAPEELLRAADAALYEAKRSGRDRVVAAAR